MGYQFALCYVLELIDAEKAKEQEEHHDFVRARIKELHKDIDRQLADFMEGE